MLGGMLCLAPAAVGKRKKEGLRAGEVSPSSCLCGLLRGRILASVPSVIAGGSRRHFHEGGFCLWAKEFLRGFPSESGRTLAFLKSRTCPTDVSSSAEECSKEWDKLHRGLPQRKHVPS